MRWLPALEDVSLGAEELPLLEDVTKQSSEDRGLITLVFVCDSDL
jgi:hypothetical protein